MKHSWSLFTIITRKYGRTHPIGQPQAGSDWVSWPTGIMSITTQVDELVVGGEACGIPWFNGVSKRWLYQVGYWYGYIRLVITNLMVIDMVGSWLISERALIKRITNKNRRYPPRWGLRSIPPFLVRPVDTFAPQRCLGGWGIIFTTLGQGVVRLVRFHSCFMIEWYWMCWVIKNQLLQFGHYNG